jgi:hypothetical protein
MPRMIGTLEAALERGLSPRRLQRLCQGGRIPGAQRIGRTWALPEDFKITAGTPGRRSRAAWLREALSGVKTRAFRQLIRGEHGQPRADPVLGVQAPVVCFEVQQALGVLARAELAMPTERSPSLMARAIARAAGELKLQHAVVETAWYSQLPEHRTRIVGAILRSVEALGPVDSNNKTAQ